ncbi:hypothetical protein [Rhodohalobacter halophilus]|uniref:hypothetical protein n=1 Tax=Rhodohalobacter halophilus TaxID=1812810 RepID=UPI00083FD2C1|nr:hypothetical protein [Rhodohalobacter halophilus]
MDEKERKKLIEQRKKKLKKKEFEKDLKQQLRHGEMKAKQQQIREEHTGKYGDRILIFFITFGVLYAAYVMLSYIGRYMFGAGMGYFGVSFEWLTPVIHVLILGASIISAVRNRSVLDDIIDFIT